MYSPDHETATDTAVPSGWGPNRSLPPLNPLKARSTLAAILTILATVAPLLGESGLATTVAEILANEAAIRDWFEGVLRGADVLIAVGSPVWFYLERRAPWRRLSFRSQ